MIPVDGGTDKFRFLYWATQAKVTYGRPVLGTVLTCYFLVSTSCSLIADLPFWFAPPIHATLPKQHVPALSSPYTTVVLNITAARVSAAVQPQHDEHDFYNADESTCAAGLGWTG